MSDPWTHALPPDTRAVGTGDPANDEDANVDALAAMGAGFNILNPVFAGGADPSGTNDSAPAFNAAIAALPVAGGVITVPPGAYKLGSTFTAAAGPHQTIRIEGSGLESTVLNSYVTGNAVYYKGSSFSGGSYGYGQGGGLGNLTIDGTNAGAGSTGLHLGDINCTRCNVQIRNFTGAGSSGLFLENTTTWTEQSDIRAMLVNNTQGVVFSKSGSGTNSFAGSSLDFTIWAAAGQDGIVFQSAVLVYHGALRVRGNFASSSSALSNAVLRFTGSSHLTGEQVDIQVETPAGTFTPTTIIMDSGSSIIGCTGILDFSHGGGTFTPTTVSAGQVGFTGVISGDVNLSPGAAYNAYVFGSSGAPQVLAAEINGYHGSGFPTVLADIFTLTLSSNLTANLTSTFYNSTKTLGIAQRVTIILRQAASGGPYTVTWTKPGSPTTSTPAVYWPGGTAPVMTATANAVDRYDLVTADGISWYGVAYQAMS